MVNSFSRAVLVGLLRMHSRVKTRLLQIGRQVLNGRVDVELRHGLTRLLVGLASIRVGLDVALGCGLTLSDLHELGLRRLRVAVGVVVGVRGGIGRLLVVDERRFLLPREDALLPLKQVDAGPRPLEQRLARWARLAVIHQIGVIRCGAVLSHRAVLRVLHVLGFSALEVRLPG